MGYLRELLYTIPAILIAITVHEFAHGYVSYRLGAVSYTHLDVYKRQQ